MIIGGRSEGTEELNVGIPDLLWRQIVPVIAVQRKIAPAKRVFRV
jgi:hypothetical protein